MSRIELPKFLDLDRCYNCKMITSPLVWVTVKGLLRFVCEDCYEKYFKEKKEKGAS